MPHEKLIAQADDRADEILARLYGANEVADSHSRAKRREVALRSFENGESDTVELFKSLDNR